MSDYSLNWTVLYKGVKGVGNAARPPEGGPAEAGDFFASCLLLSIGRPAWIPDSLLKILCVCFLDCSQDWR